MPDAAPLPELLLLEDEDEDDDDDDDDEFSGSMITWPALPGA